MKLQRARQVMDERPEVRKELKELFERIKQTPATHTVKGMYVGGLVQALQSEGVKYIPKDRIQSFKDYPLNEYMELLLDAAVTLYPKDTVQDALHRLGELAIPTFASSIIGRVIMGTVGRSWELALKCVSRGYEVGLKPGKAIVAELKADTALVQLREVWNFGESYQVGVISGLLHWCNLSGKITAHVISPCDVDLRIQWLPDRVSRGSKSQTTGARAPGP